MSGVRECFDGFRVFVHPLAHHEKGDLDPVVVQDIDEGLGIFIPPSSIECERDHLLLLLHAVDWQLPACRSGGHRGREVDQQTQGADAQQGGGNGEITLRYNEQLPGAANTKKR